MEEEIILVLPRGNALFEKVRLTYPDVNLLLTNLEAEGFTGIVKFELAKNNGVIYYIQGQAIRAMEMDESNVKVMPKARIIKKMKKQDVETSVYIFSPRLISVLALSFAFQPIYLDYEVKEKELKKVMDMLAKDNHTGILEVMSKDGTSYLLIDRGEIVTDSFASEYGQIIAGTNSVSKFLDFISREGATINAYGEKQEEIENQLAIIQDDLSKIKPLIVREEKGFAIFKSGDVFWIEEHLLQEWGYRNVKSINLEIETPDGAIHLVKGQSAKRMGGYISSTGSNLKKFGLKEQDMVNVKPIG